MEEYKNPFMDFKTTKSQPVSLNTLEPGVHKVKVVKVEFTDDVRPASEEPSSNIQEQRDWVDKNPVIYVMLACEQGIHHERFYYFGYKKWDELLRDPAFAKERHLYRPTSVINARNYAINIQTKSRVIDQRATDFARDRVNQFATALQKEGEDITSWINQEVWIELKAEWKLGKWRTRMVSFSHDEIIPAVTRETAKPKGLDTLAVLNQIEV